MCVAVPVAAEDTAPVRQSLDDAWFTGPIIAPSPVTLPKGHFYMEPYFYDMRVGGTDRVRSRTYLVYGATDRLTVGLIPIFGYNRLGGADNAGGVGVGDLTLHARYQLTSFDAESHRPATAIALEWTLPTGKYDRLKRLGDGLGDGVSALTLNFYAQEIFWAPNGHIVRGRLAVMQTIPGTATLRDVSVYGTPEGFSGTAKPGSSFTVDNAWEYSLSQRWVLAVDLLYSHTTRTRVNGVVDGEEYQAVSETADTFAIAPAIEYNWSARFGVLAGVRFIPKSHGTPSSVTPVMAISMFF